MEKKIHTVKDFSGSIFEIQRSNNLLISCSADKSVRLHQLNDRKQLHHFSKLPDWMYCVSGDPNSKLIAAGCYNGQVIVWDIEAKREVSRFYAAPGFTPNGRVSK